jgi:hypothetical protein
MLITSAQFSFGLILTYPAARLTFQRRFYMQASGRMVFTMILLAAATPFVLPRVLAPSAAPNTHPAVVGNVHPADFGNTHPADFGNTHPADFGNTHPALTAEKKAEAHRAFPDEVVDGEDVTINPSQVKGNVTFAFPHAAHVTIVLPDGVQFAVNDSRGDDRRAIGQQQNTWPGFAPLVPPTFQTNITPNPGAQVATSLRAPDGSFQSPGVALVTNRSQNPINEPAGAQPNSRHHFGPKR